MPQILLGFDYGRRRIGVALAQTLTGTTRSLCTLNGAPQPDWDGIGKLIEEWRPTRLVVGLPLNLDGTEHELTHAARRFANRLHGRYRLPVDMIDERLTSIEAEDIVTQARRSGRLRRGVARDKVDQIAAELILRGWLAQHAGA